MMESASTAWKEEIRPLLEQYADRTPGSFLEEKDFSLVWHYRRADPELGLVRARDLKEVLMRATADMNVGVMEGSKVIEIKNTAISKGRAALRLLDKEEFDFVLAIGDDWTDETTFAALPESAYSIRVGFHQTHARFNIDSVEQVRSLLETLGGGTDGDF